jgi:hypothetical protein
MAKKTRSVPRTFGVTVYVGSRTGVKGSWCGGVQVRVTGAKWISRSLRTIGGVLLSHPVASGATFVVATALVRALQ